MAKQYGRIHRLLKILTLIQTETGWNAQRLAEECGTTDRNIYRDMKMLEGAGIPYYHDKQTNGYKVRRDFFMPPVELTLDESLALIALSAEVGGKDQIPFMRPASKAIAKIRGQLPVTVRKELVDLDDHIDIQLAQSSSADGIVDVYEVVREAISRRRAMRCSYESAGYRRNDEDPEPETFLFRPYCLFWGQRAWYAVGHHEGRNEVRKLKLNRFTRAKVTDVPYHIPDDFSLVEEIGNAWRMIRGDRTHQVELHFDAEFAETIADTHWHSTQDITWQDDGSILFRCEVDGLEEILWWILSMGPHCVVRRPHELAQRVRVHAAAVVDAYRHEPK